MLEYQVVIDVVRRVSRSEAERAYCECATTSTIFYWNTNDGDETKARISRVAFRAKIGYGWLLFVNQPSSRVR